jgi:hypothetical protein
VTGALVKMGGCPVIFWPPPLPPPQDIRNREGETPARRQEMRSTADIGTSSGEPRDNG